jgi:hypothetical protein
VEQDRVSAATMEAAKPTIKHCSCEIAQLQNNLQDANNKKKASSIGKAMDSVRLKAHSDQVHHPTAAILEDVKALEAHQTFQDAALLEDIEAAIKQLHDMSDIEHTGHHIIHHGSGLLGAQTGSGNLSTFINHGSVLIQTAKSMSLEGGQGTNSK